MSLSTVHVASQRRGYHVMISKNQRQHNTMCRMSIRSCHYFEQFFRRPSFSHVNCVFLTCRLWWCQYSWICTCQGGPFRTWGAALGDGNAFWKWFRASLQTLYALNTFWTFTCNFTTICSINYRLFCSLLFLILSFDLVATWWKWSTPFRVYTCVRQTIQRGGDWGLGTVSAYKGFF